ELRRAENGLQIAGGDADRPRLAFGDAHSRVAQRLADLALEIAHAGFPRAGADDLAQGIVVDLRVAGLEGVPLHLAADQVEVRGSCGVCGAVCRARLRTCMRSRSGPGMVSSMLAVAMNTTRLRSNGTPR